MLVFTSDNNSNIFAEIFKKQQQKPMINSLLLGLFVCAFLIITQNIILKIYKLFPSYGVGIVYGSLGVKLLFVCGVTIALKSEIENSSIYAISILVGVLYANVKTVIDLHLKSEDTKKETT